MPYQGRIFCTHRLPFLRRQLAVSGMMITFTKSRNMTQGTDKWPLDKWEKATEKVGSGHWTNGKGHRESGKWPLDKWPLDKWEKATEKVGSGHWTNGKKAAKNVGSDQVGSGHRTSGKWPLDKWEKATKKVEGDQVGSGHRTSGKWPPDKWKKATEKVEGDQVGSGHQTSGKWPPDKWPLIKCSMWTAGHR